MMRPSLHLFGSLRPSNRTNLVVLLHGGGWHYGGPEQFLPWADKLADRDRLIAVVGYRTLTSEQQSGELVSASWDPQNCIDDVHKAVTHLLIALMPRRTTLVGASAGGHIALCCALGLGCPRVTALSGLYLFNPVTNTGPEGFGHSRIGGRFSPIASGRLGILPRTAIAHGDKDSRVPYEQTQRFVASAADAGASVMLRRVGGAPHGFFNEAHSEWHETMVGELRAFLQLIEGEPS